MATFGALKSKIVRRIGGNTTDNDTELGEFLNEAVREILLRTQIKVTTATVSLTANTWEYTLDSSVLLIKRVVWDGSTDDRKLRRVSPDELVEMQTRGTSPSDSFLYYALDGGDLFMVYPTPSASATLKLYVVQRPTEMSSASHDPSNATYGGIPVEFHPAIEEYGLWKFADQDDDSSSGQGERYRLGFEGADGNGGWIGKIRKYRTMKGGTTLPRAKVGRRRYVPSDNSADFR